MVIAGPRFGKLFAYLLFGQSLGILPSRFIDYGRFLSEGDLREPSNDN